MSLSVNLQKLLNIHGITVTELAKKTNVPQPVLYRLVTGHTPNPTVLTLSPIAKFLSLSISQLIGDEPFPQKIISNNTNADKLIFENKTRIPLVDWKYPINSKKALKKNLKKYVFFEESTYKDSLYALNINDYKYTMKNKIFPENTIIIIDPNLTPVNKDYILAYKKTSIYPYIAQFFNKNNEVFIKDLDDGFIIRKMSKNEKIIGVLIQSKTDYFAANRTKNQF